MPTTYAVADLHGRLDLLEMAIARIEDHAGGRGGTVVFLGDYIDRGPQSREVIERLMAGPGGSGMKWVCLQGNHESIMLRALSHHIDGWMWTQVGGGNTLLSYGAKNGDLIQPSLMLIPESHRSWIRELPLSHHVGKRFYCHAGVEYGMPLDGQTKQALQWIRYQNREQIVHPDAHVVHGHDQNKDGPLLYEGRTNLDTKAWKTGRLFIGVFDDAGTGGPEEILEIKGKPGKA